MFDHPSEGFDVFCALVDKCLILPPPLQNDMHQTVDEGDIGPEILPEVEITLTDDGNLRGSATMTLAPFAFARKTRVAMRG